MISGQSLWLDNITRGLLTSGTLRRYINELSVTGLTSNPTIFDKAIKEARLLRRRDPAESRPRANRARRCSSSSRSRILTQAADLFRPVHEAPAALTAGCRWRSRRCWPTILPETIKAAAQLHRRAQRPNLFIKIPGTPEGVPAIEESIFAGVPVNVTLLFSREQYLAAAEAYMRGIERRIAAGLDPKVGSVASMFISRWDVAVKDKVPARASQSPRDRHRQARVQRLPRAAGLAALAKACRRRRPAAAPALGQHRHQGSGGAGHALHRSAGRPGHHQHHAREDAAGLCRSRRS